MANALDVVERMCQKEALEKVIDGFMRCLEEEKVMKSEWIQRILRCFEWVSGPRHGWHLRFGGREQPRGATEATHAPARALHGHETLQAPRT